MSTENGLSPSAEAAIKAIEAIYCPDGVSDGNVRLDNAFQAVWREFQNTEEHKNLATIRAQTVTAKEKLAVAETKAVGLEQSVEKRILACATGAAGG